MKKYSKCKYHGRIYVKNEPDRIIITDKVMHLIRWLTENKPETFSVLYFGKKKTLKLSIK